jgi:HPt (histidine-containing phosphotransfer) domain-containing protein
MPLPDVSSFPFIDREQFDMLVATGEDDAVGMLTELLDLFTSEAEPKFADIMGAATDLDRIRCNRQAHALAGASANLGCLRLSKLCRAYENGAKEELTQAELIQGAKEIEVLYAASVEAMRAEIEKIGK